MTQSAGMTTSERESYTRGRTLFERGETEAALEELGKLLETRGGFADVHYMMGVLFDRQGDVEQAAERLREAVHLNPSYAEALLALASVCERRGDFERSREYAEQAGAVSRGTPGELDRTTRGKLANLQAAVGDAYAEVGEQREAIDAYRKALERCPEFHDIRYRLGVSLRNAGLPDQAIREFKRVLRGNAKLYDAHVQLGLTYYAVGRPRDARERWEAVLKRDPARRDARMYLRLIAEPKPASAKSAPASSPAPPGFGGDPL
jgi:tetratricopeptide (TPR) repeat protein